MNEAWLISIIVFETTVIGFFVRHHWLLYIDHGARITALEIDKAKRETPQP